MNPNGQPASSSEPDRSKYPVRIRRLHDPDDEAYVRALSPGERLAMVWQLTMDAWAFKEGLTVEPRLRRDVGRVVRGRG